MYDNGNWYSYNPSKPAFLNTLNIMKPGYGYWVRTTTDTVWTIEDGLIS